MQKFLKILIWLLLSFWVFATVKAQAQPRALSIIPVPTYQAKNNWFGVRLPTRNLSYFGLGAQLGFANVIANNAHVRFQTDYYFLGSGNFFELGGDIITVLNSSYLPEAPNFTLSTYLGGGPRALFISDSSDNANLFGLGAILGVEIREQNFGGFAELDITAPIISVESNNSQLYAPVFVAIALGVNFYF